MKKFLIVFDVLLYMSILIFTDELVAQTKMIAQITEDVQTNFGTYHPYPAIFTPNVPSFSIEPDFSNVNNMASNLSSVDKAFLLKNHFTVKKSKYTQIYDIYNECTWYKRPVFVTTDAVLHTYHVLFDRFLSKIEANKFVDMLDLLTETMIDSSFSVFNQVTKPIAKEAALRNLAYFSVAKKLLKGIEASIPDIVSELTASELELISKHEGFNYSPIFGNFSELDYSQFKVRGHYTKNETLRAYFKTMMWYGWSIFTMEPSLFGDLARRHTLQALILLQMLYTLEAEGHSLTNLWENIYGTTVFFVGKTDDPNLNDYKEIADQIYGDNFLSLSPDSLADSSLLDAFMNNAQLLPEPKIPNWIYGTFTKYKGFRFMGQRFIPDSYMFAHLIYPYVGTPDNQRWMPKGLDVMAILGSDRAYTLLDSLYHQTNYQNYAEKIYEFKTEFSNKPSEVWAQNLYWNWLYCLMPLLYEKGAGYPFFMQTSSWSDKELLTALASWTELRHDTILYSKQSLTPQCGVILPKSYVEPNPHLYARLASLVRYTRNGLQSRDLLLAEFQEPLDLFESLLLFLRYASIKELENIPLSDIDYQNIFSFGEIIENLVSDPEDTQNPLDNIAIVADVHTDSNRDLCLEEGVGYPLEIFVIVNEGGTTRMTRGAIFSYYEFEQPISERLTDEDWREMLVGINPPDMPEWVNNFMELIATQPKYDYYSPNNRYGNRFISNYPTVVEELINVPDEIVLHQNYPNPFNTETTVYFELPEKSFINLIIYNILGQEVQVLLKEEKIGGRYFIRWDGKNASGKPAPSGLYIYKIIAEDFVQVKKMLLIR